MPCILRREAPRTRRQPTKLPTIRLLLEDITAGIRVLKTRDGVAVSDEQILERARNIVTGLIGNYRIQSLDAQERANRDPRVVNQLELLDRVAELGRQTGRPARA
jgi:ribosomal protein S30